MRPSLWRHNGRDSVSTHQPHSGADQRNHHSSASLAFVRRPVNSPPKWPVTRRMFPFDDVIMQDYDIKAKLATLSLFGFIRVIRARQQGVGKYLVSQCKIYVYKNDHNFARANLAVLDIFKVAIYAQISVGPAAVQLRETMEHLDRLSHMWGFVLQIYRRQGQSNYIPHIPWNAIICPCPWYIFLGYKS